MVHHAGQVGEEHTGCERVHTQAVVWVGCMSIGKDLVGEDCPHGHDGRHSPDCRAGVQLGVKPGSG